MTLPKSEAFEEAAQIRRSSKRISAGIVEGFALRRYRDEFLHYLYRSLASSDETQEHLRLLWETGSLKDKKTFNELLSGYQTLSRKLSRFIVGVLREHSTPDYLRGAEIRNPESEIED